MLQEFTCAGQKLQPVDRLAELGIMISFKNINAGVAPGGNLTLSQQFADKSLPTHPDAPVNFPVGENYAAISQSVRPGGDVFVDAVDERAVEVEEHGGDAQIFVTARPQRCLALGGTLLTPALQVRSRCQMLRLISCVSYQNVARELALLTGGIRTLFSCFRRA